MAKQQHNSANQNPMFFSAYNYKMIGSAIFLIIAGFTAMFIDNQIEGFISLFIAPILVMAGFILVVFAIMKHDRDEEDNKASH